MANESFIRWQSIRIEHLGSCINMTLALSTGSLGFALDLIIDRKIQYSTINGLIFWLSAVLLVVSVSVGVIANYVRLIDFKKTAVLARDRDNEEEAAKIKLLRIDTDRLGETTWKLVRIQFLCFAVGAIILVLGVGISIENISK
jgi:hypothetical protein